MICHYRLFDTPITTAIHDEEAVTLRLFACRTVFESKIFRSNLKLLKTTTTTKTKKKIKKLMYPSQHSPDALICRLLFSAFGCLVKSTSLWVHRNLFWQLSRHGNWHSSGPHVARYDSLSKTIFQGTLGVGDTLVSRRNAEWTTSKSEHSYSCQNCSQGPPAEKTGRRPLLGRPLCSRLPPPSPRTSRRPHRSWG